MYMCETECWLDASFFKQVINLKLGNKETFAPVYPICSFY